jgi:hypothetical protein
MPRLRFLAACVATSAVALGSSPASANGRFPESNAIFVTESDPDLVLLRVTFGLLVSHDRGKTWSWVCEKSIGASGVEDPMYTVTPGGTIVGTTFQGVAVSHDRACSFAYAGGELGSLVFVDLASKPTDPKTIVAFASSYERQDEDGGILFRSQLYETTDEAKTWTPLGQRFDPYLLGETVDYAARDPDRIYVSAIRNPGEIPKAALLTSKDHGKTFVTTEIPLVSSERAVFIAAVDPTNADRIYLRTQNATDLPSRLIVSDDGGKTFRDVYAAQGALLGFALSKDGKTVWVGGPKDGVRMASTTDFGFRQKSTIEVQCLTWTPDGLWACSSEKNGFVAGLSKDEGATFEAKLHFCDVTGALSCPPGTATKTQCEPAWPQQASLLGCAASADGGADGGDGGTNPDGDGSGGGGKSCRCGVVGAPSPLTALLAGAASLAGVASFVARRRRRR